MMHDIIGNAVPLFFRQFLTKTSHEFAGASHCSMENRWRRQAAQTKPLICDLREQLRGPAVNEKRCQEADRRRGQYRQAAGAGA